LFTLKHEQKCDIIFMVYTLWFILFTNSYGNIFFTLIDIGCFALKILSVFLLQGMYLGVFKLKSEMRWWKLFGYF